MRYVVGIAFLVSMAVVMGAGPEETPQGRAATALASGRLNEVMEHIDEGADVNFKYEDDTTLLHMAAVHPDAGWLIADLVEAGANVNAQARSTRSTPLHWAASWGHPGNVQALLDAGANRDQQDRLEKTPLDKAEQGRAAALGGKEPRVAEFDEVIEILVE